MRLDAPWQALMTTGSYPAMGLGMVRSSRVALYHRIMVDRGIVIPLSIFAPQGQSMLTFRYWMPYTQLMVYANTFTFVRQSVMPKTGV